jgi:hypothetical protein
MMETSRAMRRFVGIPCLALLFVTACGTTTPAARVARPQVLELGWHENCGTRTHAMTIETRRLVVEKHRWRVELAFRNETGVTLSVTRPHVPGGTYFGLETFETASWHEVLERAERHEHIPGWLADRFTPSRPGPVGPGQRWSGSFSGPGGLPAATPIRIVLGAFVSTGALPPGFRGGFLCISERVARLE